MPAPTAAPAPTWLEQLVAERPGHPRLDRRRGALRRGRGRRPAARRARRRPARRPARAFTDPSPDPLVDLVARYARTHGPFLDQPRRPAPTASRREPVLPALEAPRGRGPGRARRVPARRRRAGVVRRRRAAPAAPPFAGRAAQGGRAGRRRRPWPASCPRGRASASPAGASTRWSRSSASLQGAALPASVARDRRAAGPRRRPTARRPRRAVHRRRGRVGRRRCPRRHRRPGPPGLPRPGLGLLAPHRPTSRRTAPVHDALLAHLDQRGASFWPELVAALGRARGPLRRRRRCWPRCGTWCGPAWSPTTRWPRCGPSLAAQDRRSRAGTAAARPRVDSPVSGPPSGGRPLVAGRPAAPPGADRATEAAHARALQLLERYGVLTREAALGEGVEGGFAGVYPVLKALEERGQVRRGYFVAGLGAAQFALPGAVDRLRAGRDGRWPRHPGRDRSRPALRRRPCLARDDRPSQPQRRRLRRPGRRRARCLL